MTYQPEPTDFAVHLVYLVCGIERKLALHQTTNRLLGSNTPHRLVQSGGHIGMVTNLTPKARLIAARLAEHNKLHPDSYCGVFEYEVTELLGLWYADNPEATDDEFAAQLDALTASFFSRYASDSST